MRPICIECKAQPAAINYKKDDKIFYRSRCFRCIRKTKQKYRKQSWEKAGYKKLLRCQRCGFTSNHNEQFDVYYVDGNLTNNTLKNLKTICANCQRIMQKENVKWKQGDLQPDF